VNPKLSIFTVRRAIVVCVVTEEMMCKAAPSLFATVCGILTCLVLASGFRDQQQMDNSACGHLDCGGPDEYCCAMSGDEGILVNGTRCEDMGLSYAPGCRPCNNDENECGFCKGPVSGIWCGPEGSICCTQMAPAVMGNIVEAATCSDPFGMDDVDGCQSQEGTSEAVEDCPYVTQSVLDGGNCMFDALARDLDPNLFQRPEDCVEVAAKAQEYRIQAAQLILNDNDHRLQFLQSLQSLNSWPGTMQNWLSRRNVTDRQSYTDHNDGEFKAWIHRVWANPPKQNGKLVGGVELYGDRFILKILAAALGKKVQVLMGNSFQPDGNPVGAESGTLLYMQQTGQHYTAVRKKDEADHLIAKMGGQVSLLVATSAINTMKLVMEIQGTLGPDSLELPNLLMMACEQVVQNDQVEGFFDEQNCYEQ